MAVIKINFFFQQGKYGWSETYYADKGSLPEAIASALIVRPFRVQLLGGGGSEYPVLKKIRVSEINRAGDSLVEVVSDADGKVPGDGLSFAEIPSTALLVRAEAGTEYRRQLYLRGQPDLVVTNNGKYTRIGAYPTTLEVFFAALIREHWGLLAATKPAPPLPLITDITQVLTRPTVAAFHTDPVAHGLVAGDNARFMSVTTSRGEKFSDDAVVLADPAPTATTFTIFTPRVDRDQAVSKLINSTRGRVRKIGIQFHSFEISNDEIIHPTAITRKAGAPLKKFVGRRSRKR